MILLSLILGIIIGAVAVTFAIQNVTEVTVNFLAWQFTAPLAVILIATTVVGIIVALLAILPSAIRESLNAYSRRNAQAKAEAAQATQVS